MSTRVSIVIALIGATCTLSTAGACRKGPSATHASLDDLFSSWGSTRILEGRLAGVVRHQRYDPPPADAPTPSPSAETLGAMARLAREERAAGRLRVPAVLELLLGHRDVAVATLTEAVARDPRSADDWNDLAVAYLAIAASAEHPAEALTRALDAAASAVSITPHAPNALFNLALAASRLNMTATAADALSRARAAETSPDWRQEIETRRSRLARQADIPWTPQRAALSNPAVSIAVRNLARIAISSPQPVKELIHDALFAQWAQSWIGERHTDAAVLADRVATLAAALEEIDGDSLLRRCASTLASTLSSRNTSLARTLAAAHVAYAEARDLSEQNRRELSGRRFADAAAGFAAAGSPCEAWATMQIAVAHYQSRELDEAARLGRQVRARAAADGSRSLLARAHWLLGLVEMQQQQMETALRDYDDAMRTYERAHEDENALVVAGAAADALRVMGEHRSGWTFLSRALGRLDRVASVRRRYVLLLNASLYASDERLPRAAMLFQNESLEAARVRGVANTVVEGLVRRARLHLADGDRAAARRDLEEAGRLLPSVTAQSSAHYEQGWLDRIWGEWLAPVDTPGSLEHLARALAAFARYEPAEVPAVYLTQGRVALGSGHPEEAEASFRRGVSAFEDRWRRLTTEQNRVSYLDEGWDLFDELIRLRAITQQDPDSAFQEAERTRARVLASLAAASTPTLDALKRQLPSGGLLVYYVALSDRLLVWSVTSERTDFRAAIVSRDELARLVAAYRGLLEAGRAREHVDALARHLFDTLMAPSLPSPRPSGPWFVVADGPLHSLPFAALVDPETNRFLVEDHELAMLPSASFLLRAPAGAVGRTAPLRALVVGAAVPTDPSLAALPAVAGEVRDVAQSYVHATILEGPAATPQRFSQKAGAYDVIHVASHAKANSRVPWASYLVLAPDPGHPMGSLAVDELSRLPLHGVRLVVLAACETAAGSIYRGEGLISLARPFLGSGATSVVGTLWSVDDRSTRAFVRAFHQAFARDRDAARALRQAQRTLLASADPTDRLPRAWSAFVVVGSPVAPPSAR